MPQELQQSSSSLEFALWRSQVEFCKDIMKTSSEKESIRQAWIWIWTQPLTDSVTLSYLSFWNLPEKLSETNKTHTWTGNRPPEAIAVTHFLCIFQKWSM